MKKILYVLTFFLISNFSHGQVTDTYVYQQEVVYQDKTSPRTAIVNPEGWSYKLPQYKTFGIKNPSDYNGLIVSLRKKLSLHSSAVLDQRTKTIVAPKPLCLSSAAKILCEPVYYVDEQPRSIKATVYHGSFKCLDAAPNKKNDPSTILHFSYNSFIGNEHFIKRSIGVLGLIELYKQSTNAVSFIEWFYTDLAVFAQQKSTDLDNLNGNIIEEYFKQRFSSYGLELYEKHDSVLDSVIIGESSGRVHDVHPLLIIPGSYFHRTLYEGYFGKEALPKFDRYEIGGREGTVILIDKSPYASDVGSYSFALHMLFIAKSLENYKMLEIMDTKVDDIHSEVNHLENLHRYTLGDHKLLWGELLYYSGDESVRSTGYWNKPLQTLGL